MASRRMKMKVTVNVGRGGPGRSGGNNVGSERNNRPPTPGPVLIQDGDPVICDTDEIVTTPKSPVKHLHLSSFPYPTSPIKRPSTPISESEPEGGTVDDDEESAGLCLVAVSPSRDISPSPPPSRSSSSSPTKHNPCMTIATLDEFHRGPGIGPVLHPSKSTRILSNIHREMGAVHAHHVTSNETLRQRLQKGTGSSAQSKYSQLRKEFLARKHKNPEKKDLTILHYTFWNPPNDDDSKRSEVDDLFEGLDTSGMKTAEILNHPSPDHSDPDSPKPDKKPIGPRVKVGPDGELIIDEQSLVVETSESVRAKKQLSEMETVMAAGSGYYRHKRVPRRGYDWTVKETVRFFKALTMCGTDFSMMAHLFPNRSRAELKAKFKREDRKNSALISQALAFQSFDPMESMTESEPESDDEDRPKKKICSGTIPSSTKPQECKVLPKTKPETQVQGLRKNMKISTPNLPTKAKRTLQKLSSLPGFVPGRPMSIGDSTKFKKFVKLEKNQDKHHDGVGVTVSENTVSVKLRPVKPKRSPRPKVQERPSTHNPTPDPLLPIIPSELEDPRLEILRFDAADPLGMKVVLEINHPSASEQLPFEDTTTGCDADAEDNVPEPPPTPVMSTVPRRSVKVKVKPRIPRVPGGGERKESPCPSSVVQEDEIEIEISCT